MLGIYYYRNIDKELLLWSKEPNRKTLLIRGARQVGKSSAVKQLGKTFKYYVEVNFDDQKEIFVGLELLKGASCYEMKRLYYWQKHSRQGNAQVDYLVQKGEQIVPVEVKASTQGAMQSLRLFMKEKKIDKGIRTSLENFGMYENIEVYPMYAISNLIR